MLPAPELERLRRLATAVEQAHDSVVITDLHDVIEYVNPAFERLTGYSVSELQGATPKLLQSGEHDRAFYAELRRTLEAGEVWHGHFVNRRKDGSHYREEATISPVRDEEGRVSGYVAVKKDVTRQFELEDELSAAREREAVLRSERAILDETVAGTVRLLTEMLSMVSPVAFGKATRAARYVDVVCELLEIDDWHLRMAAMLCQMGAVAVPTEIVDKARHGLTLEASERHLLQGHPRIAMKLLSEVPRLERVAAIVGAVAKPDGADEWPEVEGPQLEGSDIDGSLAPPGTAVSVAYGGALLRAALFFDRQLQAGLARDRVVAEMAEPERRIPPEVIGAFRSVRLEQSELVPRAVTIRELLPGMRLEQDIVSRSGTLLVRGGQDVTHTVLTHLHKLAAAHGVAEPVRVLAPAYLTRTPAGAGGH